MKTYITGSNGFLGSHLIDKLKDNVIAIPHDEISTTKIDSFQKFFFVSTYGNMSFHDDDQKIIKANILDLVSVLSQIDFTNGMTSFIFVSTSSVKRHNKTMYSRTKNAAEEILLSFKEKYNAPICIIRPFTITGVGEQKEHLIPTLIRSCYTGESMPFVPDAVHDYVDVDDVVDAMIQLSDRHAKGIFEVGKGVGFTNLEIKEMVEKITGKKANTHEVSNMRSYDSADWVSTNFKIRNYGWHPKKSIELSIKEMVQEYLN